MTRLQTPMKYGKSFSSQDDNSKSSRLGKVICIPASTVMLFDERTRVESDNEDSKGRPNTEDGMVPFSELYDRSSRAAHRRFLCRKYPTPTECCSGGSLSFSKCGRRKKLSVRTPPRLVCPRSTYLKEDEEIFTGNGDEMLTP
ncbi:hypothetical protein H5410_058995 [Solanum commersonii]|uniref:Uncharacterized protein n=1 Tax=Solanum commersonii TaxID=4109 RepID=A0A9J5W163_SOLCO|nr:hypothetical protein H5410_058995 [Solanum commersonii]